MQIRKEYSVVCQNVLHLRRISGLSRSAMAKKLHISIKTLDLLEAGVFPERIHIGFFFHVQQAFGISPQSLLTKLLQDR